MDCNRTTKNTILTITKQQQKNAAATESSFSLSFYIIWKKLKSSKLQEMSTMTKEKLKKKYVA